MLTQKTRPQTRIAVLVSGGGTNLQALIDARDSGLLPDGELALVVADKAEAYALERASRAGIRSTVVCRKSFGDRAAFEQALVAVLEENNIQMIVLAGFMCILSADFTARYPKRMLNVHPSLIPAFCGEGFFGLRVHEAALEKGVKVTGATVHFVNEVPDGGEIILQKAVSVCRNDTPKSLQQRVMRCAEWKILPRATQLVAKKIRLEGEQYGHL